MMSTSFWWDTVTKHQQTAIKKTITKTMMIRSLIDKLSPTLVPLWTILLLVAMATVLLIIRPSRRRREKTPIAFQRASHFTPEAVPKDLDTIVIGSGPGTFKEVVAVVLVR